MIIAGVAVSVLIVLAVGIYVAKKVDGDSHKYFVAGRALAYPVVGVALTAAAVDANATVGATDLTAQFGFWAGASLPIGMAICLTLCGLFVAKRINAMRLFTLADFFRLRYGRGVEVLSSVIMVLAYTFLLAGNLVACGFLLERFAGIPYVAGIAIAAALVLAYTIGGGLFSDAYTSLIQMAITVTAAVSMLVWVVVRWGLVMPDGMGPLDLEQLTSASAGAPVNWATLVALGVGDIVAIDFMQRILGAKSPASAQRACFVGAGITGFVGVVVGLVAVSVAATLKVDAAKEPVLYTLLGDYAPPALAILVLSGVVAASFSTASGAILATSGVVVRNLANQRRLFVDGRDPLLTRTRLTMIPYLLVGVVVAIYVDQTAILLTLCFDLLLVCLAAPLVVGLFWTRPSRAAAYAGIVVGLVVRLVFLALTPTLYGVDNNILYIKNSLVGAGFDGWATLLAAAIGWATFLVVALLVRRPAAQGEWETLERDALVKEQSSRPIAVPA